jgi:hypothetical protein
LSLLVAVVGIGSEVLEIVLIKPWFLVVSNERNLSHANHDLNSQNFFLRRTARNVLR